jgi:hypothetical protein
MTDFTPVRGGLNPTSGKVSKSGAFSEDVPSAPELESLTAHVCFFGLPAAECQGGVGGCSDRCENTADAQEVAGIANDFSDRHGNLYRQDLTDWIDYADTDRNGAGHAVRERMRQAMANVGDGWGNVTLIDTLTEFTRLTDEVGRATLAEREFMANVISAHQHIDDDLRCVCGVQLDGPVNRSHAAHVAEQIQATVAARAAN